MSSRPLQRRSERRDALQGTQRGLRGAEGPAAPRGLRPLRPCRLRSGAWRRGGRRRLRRRFLGLDVGDVRRSVRRVHGPAPARASARGASAAPISATTWRSRCPKPIRARRRRSACRHPSPAKAARARAPRSAPRRRSCRTCGGIGKVRATPGLLHHRAHLSVLPGTRRDHRDALPVLQRRGPRHARADAVGHHPDRRRGRHAHQACRRRRGGIARRPARRSLHLPLDQAA